MDFKNFDLSRIAFCLAIDALCWIIPEKATGILVTFAQLLAIILTIFCAKFLILSKLNVGAVSGG